MAYGNFEGELKLMGGAVEACGPLHWAGPPPAEAILVHVRITQDKVVGLGPSAGPFRPGDPMWEVNVEARAGSAFQPGPAEGVATATVIFSDGIATHELWRESIEIKGTS